ncbi:MAG: DUF421 domain-containing protein [Clostridia bacterium]|nr:DUF421 domain-containing protein [Clostridia bacterium]
MITVFLRAMILFVWAVCAMRIMGKRQVGQFQPFELVVAIMIAELAATPMEDVGTPLLYGLVPMMALVMLHGIMTLLSMKSQRWRRLINGAPTVLIKDGAIQQEALEKLCFSLNDLMEELRMAGMLDVNQVGTAIMETSGQVSVFPKADQRPLTPDDLDMAVKKEGIPLTLILDGSVQKSNLALGGLDEKWLLKRLRPLGYKAAQEVLFCSLNPAGEMLVQGRKADQMHMVQAMKPEEAKW